ncbi:hypothetical protein K460DRAFT_245648, partial [Cucurbitaria berberidis CBS 394.84]
MPYKILKSAICIQKFNNLLNSAIYTTFCILLRFLLIPELKNLLLKVIIII